MSQLTPEKLAEISEQLQGKLFEPTQTAEQVEMQKKVADNIKKIQDVK